MTPIELLRTLFHFDNTLDDYQIVAAVFKEYTRTIANGASWIIPKEEGTMVYRNPFTGDFIIDKKENK